MSTSRKKFIINTKAIVMFIAAVVMVVFCQMTARAESKELTINVDRDFTNAVLDITWENTKVKAKVNIVSPDGTAYNETNSKDKLYVTDGEAMINLGTPAKGEWKITVEGDSLGTVNADMGQLPETLKIDSFTVTGDDTNYQASYQVSESPETVDIEIYADTDGENFDGTMVYSAGYVTPSGQVNIDMSGLKSGEYHFYLIVKNQGAFKRAYADEILSYQNPNVTDKVQNVKAGKYNDGYYISWNCEGDGDLFDVYIFDSSNNLLDTQNVMGEGFYYGEFPDDIDKLNLAVVYSERDCNYDKIEVSKDTKFNGSVKFDVKENYTNHSYIVADVSLEGKSTFDAYLNDELEIEKKSEDGKYKINLEDGDNEVIFKVTDEAGNIKEFSKDIYVDTVPPALSVENDVDGVTTNKKYIYISGYSESGAKLTLNDKKIKMEKGYFSYKVELNYGTNKLNLVAEDMAGNKSAYSATVKCELNKKSRFDMYIVSGVIGLLLICYMIVFVKGFKRKRADK